MRPQAGRGSLSSVHAQFGIGLETDLWQSSFPRDGRTGDSHALPLEKRIIILIHFVLTRLISSMILSLLCVDDEKDGDVTAGQAYRWITNEQFSTVFSSHNLKFIRWALLPCIFHFHQIGDCRATKARIWLNPKIVPILRTSA